jgi:hypothetical protein
MPDWKQIVRERLARRCGEEVTAELAAHLEETYEQARACGVQEADAMLIALQEVDNWHVLAAKIAHARSKEVPMNDRTKSLWLPAMAGILGAGLAVTALPWIGVRPLHVMYGHDSVWTGASVAVCGPSRRCGDIAIFFYWPWLAATPAIGALGAYLSRRAAGRVGTRLLAGLAPALLIFLGSFMTEPVVPVASYSNYYFYCATNWVLIPGLLLLLGTLPFLQKSPVHHQTTT